MRLWSIHPKYLDSKGLVALWREGLLARHVLAGKTKGYKHHPQLDRFKKASDPLAAIDAYLERVVEEAKERGYSFDAKKIRLGKNVARMRVTSGQVEHEWEHLMSKLKVRDPERLKNLKSTKKIQTHSLFRRVIGKIEDWERNITQS